MVMLYGALSATAGAALVARERREFWPVLRGLVALGLMFVGGVLFIVGLSERRARKQYREATQEDSANGKK
jgi:ABC-type transporter Mla subunit MlaD